MFLCVCVCLYDCVCLCLTTQPNILTSFSPRHQDQTRRFCISSCHSVLWQAGRLPNVSYACWFETNYAGLRLGERLSLQSLRRVNLKSHSSYTNVHSMIGQLARPDPAYKNTHANVLQNVWAWNYKRHQLHPRSDDGEWWWCQQQRQSPMRMGLFFWGSWIGAQLFRVVNPWVALVDNRNCCLEYPEDGPQTDLHSCVQGRECLRARCFQASFLYCTPPVCVSDEIGAPAVWRQNNNNNKKKEFGNKSVRRCGFRVIIPICEPTLAGGLGMICS